jgi:hypothetical protein
VSTPAVVVSRLDNQAGIRSLATAFPPQNA